MKKNKFFKEKSLNLSKFSKEYKKYLSNIIKKLDKRKIEKQKKL